ncbi:hypothetical protein D9611_010208 [Ephemerocybe angulata]|uniref:Uncharacterized protein n=2 Tax=Ephemerocybe angulata TaxID=980116 RepID=A0A8H5AZ32_9AGAR|nr:hypothetical protein D9611_010208 [Tulosesus angulatus]KAF6760667.1 hypothetical protein DFP72DRAFT_77637 [Tulosesus angulatus]
MSILSLPLISGYSFWTQFSILGLFLVISYLHRTSRLVLTTLVAGSIIIKLLVPTVQLIIYLAKGVAWIGFYIYFIQYAIQAALTGFLWLVDDGLPSLVNEYEKARGTRYEPGRPPAPMEEVD